MDCFYRQILHKPATILIFILTLILSSGTMAQDTNEVPFIVVIDPGHGGKDPGTVGRKSFEKNVNLAVARKLGFYLSSLLPDVKVYYTRTTDVFVDLDVRAKMANDLHADLFISIHANAVKDRSVYGTESWVLGSKKNDGNFDLVTKENKVITLEDNYKTKYAGFDPNNKASYIMFSLIQNNNLHQSLNIAEKIQTEIRSRAKRKDRGAFQGALVVLWKTTMPGVLVELGFLSNPREEQFLNSNNGQDIMASALFRAIRSYKKDIQQHDQGTQITETPVTISQSDAVTSKIKKSTPVKVKKSPPARQKNASASPDVEFRVQVMSSKNHIPSGSKAFKGINNFEEILIDGYYKYMTPPVKNYQEAKALRDKLDYSFKGAFIVPFRNGKKISLKEALRTPL